MAAFDYIAVDAAGATCSGTLSADARPQAIAQLAERGLSAVSVSPASAATGGGGDLRSKATQLAASRSISVGAGNGDRSGIKLSGQVAEDFCRELGSLLSAGISMSRALAILASQANRKGRDVIRGINADVVGGKSLAEAMGRYPGVFSSVQVAMVRAGETGGFLDIVLGQIADFQNSQRDLVSRLQSALAYPAILAVVATSVLVFLLTYFIPKFSEMFADFGGSLPQLTQIIIAVSNVLINHGLAAAGAIVVIVIVLRQVFSGDAAQLKLQQALLGAPLIGRVIAEFAMVRFCRMLSALIAAGVPLVASLNVARQAIGNRVLSETIALAIEDVVSGGSLSESLRNAGELFPISAIEMIAVAEQAGRLEDELGRLADVFQRKLDHRLRMLVTMAEPLMLFVMAALVAVIVIGMLLPIFNLQDLIQ